MNNLELFNAKFQPNENITYLANGVNSTYSFANNSLFYAFVNPSYRDYYLRSVKEDLEWLDGYVNYFHNVSNGMFSTRIAKSICTTLTNEIFGASIDFKTNGKLDKTSLDFINKWNKEQCDFYEVAKLATLYGGASGTALMKINQTYGNLWVEALRQDQFYFETDYRGELTDLTCYIKSYMNTNKGSGEEQVNYMLVEHRFFKEETKETTITLVNGVKKVYEKLEKVPYVEYRVYRYVGSITQNFNFRDASVEKGLEFIDIPKPFRRKLQKDYTAIRLNEPMRLPFENLGAQLIMPNGIDPCVPFGRFGASWLSSIRATMQKYDMQFSYSVRDMDNGKGKIGYPKSLTMGDLQKSSAKPAFNASDYEFNGDPSTQKPIITQFEMRGYEWVNIRDDIIKEIAFNLGVSVNIITSYIERGNSRRTATEIESTDASMHAFRNERRTILEKQFNKVLATICKFYALDNIVMVAFKQPVPENEKEKLQIEYSKYDKGLITRKQLIKAINPTADEKEVEKLYLLSLEGDKELYARKVKELELNSGIHTVPEKESGDNDIEYITKKENIYDIR